MDSTGAACMIHQARAVRVAQVLNMADNQVSGMVKLRGVPKLRALILTNNAITGIRGVPPVMTAQSSIDHHTASTADPDHRSLKPSPLRCRAGQAAGSQHTCDQEQQHHGAE